MIYVSDMSTDTIIDQLTTKARTSSQKSFNLSTSKTEVDMHQITTNTLIHPLV